MSYTSGFFDAVDLGGGEYDREYSAAVFAHYFSLLVKNGVFPDPSTGMQVKASASPDMHVSVQPGSGWVNGYYITVPENGPEVLTVPTANPSLSRIDSVIMGLNYVEREIQLYIKSGTVSASPSAVSLQRDNDLYEMELAQITVAAGVASISQANITDMRQNTSRCGIVKGTIEQIDTTDLFAQYNDAFQTWFADIQAQLSGNVATNLQNQINNLKDGKADTSVTDSLQNQVNSLKDGKVNVSDKASTAQAQAGTDNTKWMTPSLVLALLNYRLATTAEAQAGSVDNKWMTPAKVKAFHDYIKATTAEAKAGSLTTKWINPSSMLSAIDWYERSSYMAFCANVNSDSLDAAFGKNNVSNVRAIGHQLAMYSWFKGDSTSANPYTVTVSLNTLSSIYSNLDAILEVEKTDTIAALIDASPFAKSIRDNALSVESTICPVIAAKVGLSNPKSYTSLNSLTATSTFMNNYNSLLIAFKYPLFCSLFVRNNTAWTRMTSYKNAMKAFENSADMQSYLQSNKATVLTHVSASGTTATDQVQTSGYCYILEFMGDGGNWGCRTTITTSVTGKTFNSVVSGTNAFFHPCTITRTKTSATFSAYFKKIS